MSLGLVVIQNNPLGFDSLLTWQEISWNAETTIQRVSEERQEQNSQQRLSEIVFKTHFSWVRIDRKFWFEEFFDSGDVSQSNNHSAKWWRVAWFENCCCVFGNNVLLCERVFSCQIQVCQEGQHQREFWSEWLLSFCFWTNNHCEEWFESVRRQFGRA